MWGDRIERDHAPLALGLDLRVDGEPAGSVAVFAHGLCETDAAWGLGGGPTYGERLREDLGHTPVYARYNTGRHISDNGRALAAALEALVEDWPVPVEELVLVGHSMGGLVARSACHYGERDGLAGRGRCATSSASARRTTARRSSAPPPAAATCSPGFPRPPRSRAC